MRPDRTILASYREIDRIDRRELDREELVKFLLVNNIEPVAIEAEGMKLIFVFDKTQTGELEKDAMSNRSILVSWDKISHANDTWKNALALLKSNRQ
jgi:hypothetical protein